MSNSSYEDFIKIKNSKKTHKSKPNHPKGYSPGVDMKGTSGVITSPPLKDKADLNWDAYIDEWLGDGASEMFFIKEDEPVNFRIWDTNTADGVQKFYYFKTNLYSRKTTIPDSDVDAVVKQIGKRKPVKPTSVDVIDSCLVIGIADLQIGKKNTEQVVERYMNSIYGIKNDVKLLKKKHGIEKLVICTMGDLVENCSNNFYAMGLFEQMLDNRQQMRVVRRLLTKTIEVLAPLFAEVEIIGCAGNHGERRQGGKANTSFGDNADIEVLESVQEIFERVEGFDHLKWHIPDNDLTVTTEVLPKTYLSISHGHQATSGSIAAAKMINWFTKMSSNKTKGQIWDTDVMLTAHYHHHFSVEHDTRLFVGCAAYDMSGQQWWTERGNPLSLHGVTTFVMHSNKPRKWSDINIY